MAGYRILRVSSSVLLAPFRDGQHKNLRTMVTGGLPPDAVITDVRMSWPQGAVVEIKVKSDAWEPEPEMSHIRFLEPWIAVDLPEPAPLIIEGAD